MTPWRTPTVVGLCEGMREAQDYSAAPVLADALQDADYPDGGVLARLRGPLERWEAERLVALIYSDRTAAAVEAIEGYAEELGEGGYPANPPAMSYERLMEAARRFVESCDDGLEGGSMDWSNASMDGNEAFWANFQLVTGTPVPANGYDFLSCTC
jgi:hypothetical protein